MDNLSIASDLTVSGLATAPLEAARTLPICGVSGSPDVWFTDTAAIGAAIESRLVAIGQRRQDGQQSKGPLVAPPTAAWVASAGK